MQSFVVTGWEKARQRRKSWRTVEADTAEHAVERVAASRPPGKQPGVYEAWPQYEPAQNVRITLAQPDR